MMKTRDTYETLAREAAVFHRSLFRSEVPKGIREKYIDAHRFVLVEADQGPEDKLGRLIRLAIHRRLDPEALEIALRKKLGTANLLTQKI
ncbi:MAG: hypothetical protein U9N45_07970, partial [Gemmatimonadota bacterium]|nr:hypothetical protein [Gemmatimonadota bacterium]